MGENEQITVPLKPVCDLAATWYVLEIATGSTKMVQAGQTKGELAINLCINKSRLNLTHAFLLNLRIYTRNLGSLS